MRTLNECRAEVFARSQKRLAAAKARRRFIVLFTALALCIALAAAILPMAFDYGPTKNGGDSRTTVQSTDGINGAPTNNGGDGAGGDGTADDDYISFISTLNLMENVTANSVTADEGYAENSQALAAFSMELFKNCLKPGQSTLVSPVSVIYALAMTANGAGGSTREQMEDVLGMSVDELNTYLYAYRQSVAKWDRSTLDISNSVWFRNKAFPADPEFLQINADYYGADIYAAPFDQSTVDDMNYWVNRKTRGMIPKIVDQLDDNNVMTLINALAFEANWSEPYEKHQIKEGTFTASDGSLQSAEFMEEKLSFYIEDKYARGFVKYYEGNRFVFVALLPDRGISTEEYISSFDGNTVSDLIGSARAGNVFIKLPKFTSGSDTDLKNVLSDMGMPDAFSEGADFSGLYVGAIDGPVRIGDVSQKTYIDLNEEGTSAGAATIVQVESDGLDDDICLPTVRIELDRPFVYMIVDRENMLPIMIGTLEALEEGQQ